MYYICLTKKVLTFCRYPKEGITKHKISNLNKCINKLVFLILLFYICSMKAYVYTHIRLDTNEIFYVGIGTQDNYKRASHVHNRTNYWNNIVKKCGWKVDIVYDNLTWEDACKIEVELIAKYGRVDLGTGTLVNLTAVGEGTLKRITTPETRLKMSKSNKGRKYSEEHKAKTRNSMLGKNCKKIINTETGEVFKSVEEAANSIGISRVALSLKLTGKTKNKTNLNYL